jgi:putative transposase
VLDLYSCFAIGWAMSDHPTVDLVERALIMALANRNPTAGLPHSDRGSQYPATRYQRLLHERGITTSISRNGDCGDNDYDESFFGTLKCEFVYHRHYAPPKDARPDIFASIEVFFIRRRRHSTLGYDSPAEFEARTAVA